MTDPATTLGQLMRLSSQTFDNWETRGNEVLWLDIARQLDRTPLPTSELSLRAIIASHFEELTGQGIYESPANDFYVESYATGGLSSGVISPRWWAGYALDHLIKACLEIVGRDDFLAVTSRDDAGEFAFQPASNLPTGFVALSLKQETLERYRLPNVVYPVGIEFAAAAIKADGELAWAALLHGVQQTMSLAGNDWQAFECQANALCDLIAKPSETLSETAAGDEWWLEFGQVDLSKEIVTIQRQGHLLAAMQPRRDGRLKVACYRPIEGRVAEMLTGLGMNPHPEHGVCMRENNWEYALDCAAGMGNAYSDREGLSYRSYWEYGLGLDYERNELPDWFNQRQLKPINPHRSAIQVGAWYTFSERINLNGGV